MEDENVKTPCTGVCTLDDEDKYCIGCYRSRAELVGWRKMDNDEKRDVLKNVEQRIADLAEGKKIAV
ncbi:DUF1289 domain-containing protein [Terasakiella sp. SH-1]|uniref:DUF1289 domain-containing protein n=1 Tax=Terasakiella sp. SH-1 TaxID=2560057 RepID=UPI001073A874|nr:DUF1289 domain-containing protein [Terasakiella sp. SH-1]